jgi:monothiol glutaredoxin
MMHPKLHDELMSPDATDVALEKMRHFHADTVREVREAVRKGGVVVVGMAWNTNVGRARRALDEAGVPYTYLGYGNYLSGWRQRLAIKLWSGWPTFPQVYVAGKLIGGADQTQEALANGSLRALIGTPAGGPAPAPAT